jgi:hypothetical protein
LTNVFADEEAVEEDTLEVFEGDTLHLFDDEEPPVAVDELFDDFFYNFIGDPRFQGQRITYPLPCRKADSVARLAKRDWAQHDHFRHRELMSMIYEREGDLILSKDTTVRSVEVEWIPLKHDQVETFSFKRVSGKWMLTGIERESWKDTPNGDFLDFYAQFVADSTFQRESLATPVKVILTSEDGEEEPQVEEVNADEWFEMRESLPLPQDEILNVDYGQACINPHTKILLLQGIGNGLQMKFKFGKHGDDWKLTEIEY